ncbi:MAG: hypothetical protein Q4A59_03585 [Erysipelotrichaceae bacterium]|nr:hypothetical protein [Erysipelotrichaceae bacterium]
MTKSTQHTAKKKKKKKIFTPKHVLYSLLFLSVVGYIGVCLLLRSYSDNLAKTNQELTSDISTYSANVDELKDEIYQLQEKSRVLGMLDGQVSENSNNVYYYDSEQ